MSRHFVQQYSESYLLEKRSHAEIIEQKDVESFLACSLVVSRGIQDYGRMALPDAERSDYETMRSWSNSSQRIKTLEREIVSIFVEGKYAPYSKGNDTEMKMIKRAIGHHPQIHDYMKQNGFEFDPDYPDSV